MIPESIAIDGPAASGKSTVGGGLALRLGFFYFDTGVMYRAVTLASLRHGIPVTDEKQVSRLAAQVAIDVQPPTVDDGRQYNVLLDGEDVTWAIRSAEVDADVSRVAAYPEVRAVLTEAQRRIGQRGKVVMVGRDIGTIVLPDAEMKVFLRASAEERARRRYLELINRGKQVDYKAILEAVHRRDAIDSSREVAPLRPAADAIIVDTDRIGIQGVVDYLEALYKQIHVRGATETV